MLTFEDGRNRFNFRVAGVAIHNNRILLHTTPDLNFWVLPGGRVEFNETTGDGILREMDEELGVQVQAVRLLYVHELIYGEAGRNFHELGFYYLISFPEHHEILDRNSRFYGLEDGGRLIFKWFSFEELGEAEVYPEFIKRDIRHILPIEGIRHEITIGEGRL